jgi:transposase
MIFNVDHIDNIYLVIEYVDFRKSIDGLSAIVDHHLNLKSTDNSLFLFTNKRRNSIKILYYEYNGFWIFQKKLLSNEHFRWPKISQLDKVVVTKKELEWLLSGMELTPKYKFKPTKIIT